MASLSRREAIAFALGVLAVTFAGAGAGAWIKGWISEKTALAIYALSFPLTIPMAFATRQLLGWFVVAFCIFVAGMALFAHLSN